MRSPRPPDECTRAPQRTARQISRRTPRSVATWVSTTAAGLTYIVTVATNWRASRHIRARSVQQLEPDHPGHDREQAEQACDGRGLAERDHPVEGSARGADR